MKASMGHRLLCLGVDAMQKKLELLGRVSGYYPPNTGESMDMQLETENGVTKEVNRDMTGCRDYGPFGGCQP